MFPALLVRGERLHTRLSVRRANVRLIYSQGRRLGLDSERGTQPPKAYEYIVNGKSAIEWVMERYQVTVDDGKNGSMIRNDPNDWSREHNRPRYILDLLLSVINVSVKTVDIVNTLPSLDL